MVGRPPQRIARLIGPLLVALAIIGCGGPIGPPRVSPSHSPSPEPTASGEQASSRAEAICAAVYAGRGSAPHADSGDLADEMALFQLWHADLLEDAISQLGSAPELDELVAAMDEMRSLSARAALIYVEHPIVSEELDRISERQTALAEEVGPIAVEAGAPTCAAVVALP